MSPLKKINGRYEIRAKLGEGGMGVVYRVYDPPPVNRDVALKTILLESSDSVALQLFYKECEVLKSISHPNIVEIFDIGEFEDGGAKRPFFVMPLLPGRTLDELLRNASHRLTVERVVEIMSQTCRGLQAAHERGLVHRDLKPSNIFVMEDDSVKIIDFGVAHVVDSRSHVSSFLKGTLLYMSPEQVQYKPVTPQSDIFSLGVVCYEALTRRQPFRGSGEEGIVQAILRHIPPPASDLNPAVGQTVSRAVHKAMAKQAWNRYDNVREFGETLQKALRNQPIEFFDPARTQPRIQRATKALDSGDYQFAGEIVTELESEGNIDPQITLLRTQIDQVVRQRTIAQLLESARARYEEEEDPLALQKIQEILQLDPSNAPALGLKSKIEDRRSERQIEKWLALARQHVDNHSYSHARQALEQAFQLRPKEPRASRLLARIEKEEQEYFRLRQEKSQIYQAALNAWRNGEVSQALSSMGRVLELDRRAPDSSSPDTSITYQSLYNKVRLEHDAINNGYAEARRHLAEHEFDKAEKICQEFLAKYSEHALFQALKFDIEEQRGQQRSAFIADVDHRLDSEPDLDAKVSLLREALATYPGEAHFQRALEVTSNKRDLVNSIVARARLHEESGLINEALGDFGILRTIYGPYPGLQFEVERLQKRLEQQAIEATKAGWIEQADEQLQQGDYSRCLEVVKKASADFADDPELTQLQKLAEQGLERASQAGQLLAEGRELCAKGNFEHGLETLKKAHEADQQDPAIRTALRDTLIERARITIDNDWRAAEALIDRALELDPNHPLGKSLRAQVLDRRRDELVTQCASHARSLQASSDLEAAVAEVEKGLAAYPLEPRLTTIKATLTQKLGDSRRSQIRSGDLEQSKSLRPQPEATSDIGNQTTIFERTRGLSQVRKEETQSVPQQVEHIVNGMEPENSPHLLSEGQLDQQLVEQSRLDFKLTGLFEKLPPWLSVRRLSWVLGIFVIAVIALTGRHLHNVRVIAPVSIQIGTNPEGAAIQIDGQVVGNSNQKFDLRPGDHDIEVSLSGYVSASKRISVRPGSPATVDLTLLPLEQVVRIATPDLEDGEARLDNNPAGELGNGSLALPNIAAGDHVLRISASGSTPEDATISFHVTPGDIPSVKPALETHQLQVVVVSSKTNVAHIISSLGPVAVMVDGNPAGQLNATGLQVNNLTQGIHELTLGDGKDQRRMSFVVGLQPALDAVLYSDRDVGSMLVLTSLDGVNVFIDGHPYAEQTQKGELLIPNLQTTQHTVRVTKDGFSEPVPQKVAIVKGQEARIKFALVPVPKKPLLATLSIGHMIPGVQIFLDDMPIGTVGSDGSLLRADVSPGNHSLHFVMKGYQEKRIAKDFAAGETVQFSSSDINLQSSQATLEISLRGNTPVTVLRGDQAIRQFTGSSKLALDEGSYTVVLHPSAGPPISQVVSLAAGDSKSIAPAVPTGMELWENSASWVPHDEWVAHRGNGFILYDALRGPGEFSFTVKLHHKGPRLKWVVDYVDASNYFIFEMDNKNLYRTEVVDGKKHELPKVPHNIPEDNVSVSLRIDVSPNSLAHLYSLRGDPSWKTLDTQERKDAPSLAQAKPRSFVDGKFGFYLQGNDDVVELSNFQMTPR